MRVFTYALEYTGGSQASKGLLKHKKGQTDDIYLQPKTIALYSFFLVGNFCKTDW